MVDIAHYIIVIVLLLYTVQYFLIATVIVENSHVVYIHMKQLKNVHVNVEMFDP